MQKNFLPEGVEKTNYPKYNFSYLTGNSPSTIFLVGKFSCHRAVTVQQNYAKANSYLDVKILDGATLNFGRLTATWCYGKRAAHGISLTWPTRCCSSPTAVELESLVVEFVLNNC